MSATKPTVLIVCAAWHIPGHYARLSNALQVLGFKVHVPHLPTANGARPPTADLYADSEFIRGVVTNLADKGQKIVVLMHSYGGLVGTNALHGLGLQERIVDGKSGGITHLVYMAATSYLEGISMQSMAVKATGQNFVDLSPVPFLHVNEDGSVECTDPRVLMFGPDFHGPEIDAYVSSVGIWNVQALMQPVQRVCAWRSIPVTYIQATQDMMMPSVFQEVLINDMEKEGVKVNVYKIPGPHCFNFTHAKDIAEIVSNLSQA